MAVSFEALAMAGVDCLDCKISIEEWEGKYALQNPPYLLAKEKKTPRRYFSLPNFRRESKVCDGPEEEILPKEIQATLEPRERKIKRSVKSIAALIRKIVRGISKVFGKKKRESLLVQN